MKLQHLFKAGAALTVVGAALASTSVMAQDASTPTVSPGAACDVENDPACADDSESSVIIVTGSILRTTREDANPVTVIDADNLDTRGITTVEDAIQNLSANGAGTLPNSFTANGAFAAGASAASLRGLTVSSTLVLFDGLRAAYYPLADDGTRNFVDLNTIPDATVERVEVLKDGASSTYGADAIAGVVNIITKRQITGLHLDAEAGISQRGDAGQRNLALTYGVGDLAIDGFNIYASGRYYESDALYNRQRKGYLGSDAPLLCNDDGTDCLATGVVNGREFNGDFDGFGTSQVGFLSRPYTPGGGAVGPYERYDLGDNCYGYPTTTLSPAEVAAEGILGSSELCQNDITQNFGVVTPDQKRINATVRATAALNDSIEGYVQVNFARSDVSYDYIPSLIVSTTAPAASGIRFNTNPLYLPVYLCDDPTPTLTGLNGCDATSAGARLNPNNPYAADGNTARIFGWLPDINETQKYLTNSYRAAAGVSGEFADGWYFDVSGTAMKVDLERELGGRVYVANLQQVVADGSYNFVNPSANSQAVRDFLAPTIYNRNDSQLYHLQGSIARDLFELPGGPLQLGLGASIRYESVDAPSANPDNSSDPDLVDPAQRYLRVNPFGSAGSRTVWSAFAEANAPITDFATVNLSGRYDKYNTGQNYFSPKATLEVSPVDQFKLRGTYSRGFRIGSFAEFGADPTTGYITGTATVSDAVTAQYVAANGGTLPAYLGTYSLGLTQVGNPNLDPEKSRNFTVGIVGEPVRGFSFTVDYWDIKKTDLITGADFNPAVEAYYAGQPIPEGFTVVADDPSTDPAFAGLLPRIAFVQYSFTNKDSSRARGIDFAASASFDISPDINFSSSIEGSRLLELSQTVDGVKQEYQGSIGPYVITSAAGSPKWRGSWQNTLKYKNIYLSGTVYHTSGYKTTAEDIFGEDTINDCDTSLASSYYLSGDSYQCRVKSFTYGNVSVGFDATDNYRFHLTVNNITDEKPPIDTATYGGHLYNPAWADAGVIGRYFKAGVRAKF